MKKLREMVADKILVEPNKLEEEKITASGIIIQQDKQTLLTYEGTVIAVGWGIIIDGKVKKPYVQAGDKVLFTKYGHDEIQIDNKEYYVMSESALLAIIDN